MTESMTDLLVCGAELYMLWDLGRNLLRVNEKRTSVRTAGIAVLYAAFVAANSADSSFLNFMVVPVIYILFSFWNFGESVLKRLALAVCYYMLAIVPEFVAALLLKADSQFYYRLEHNGELQNLWIIFLMKIMTFLLVKCVEQIHRKKFYEAGQDQIFLSLLILPLATMLLLCGMFYSDIHTTSRTARGLLLCGVVFLIFANGFVFHLFDRMLASREKAQKLEKLYLKSNMERKYLEKMITYDEERKRLLHDVNKYMRTAAGCISTGSIREAARIFEKMDLKIRETNLAEYSRSRILNVILTDRKETAEQEGIDLEIRVEPEIDFAFIEETDLIAILGNLLDNSFEAACLCSGDRSVSIIIHTENQGHFLLIRISNRYQLEPVHGEKGYLSGKKDKKGHGIGIHTVEQIVKQYGGRIEIGIDRENRVFAVTILFQN